MFKWAVALLVFVQVIHAHDDHSQSNSHNQNSIKPLADYSIPNLLTDSGKLPTNWIVGESTTLQEGRFILNPKENNKGSMWWKKPIQDLNQFTVEWTFRSLKYQGKHSGGLAFWFLKNTDKDKYTNDKKLFNGPTKFNGLQLLVDNNSPLQQSIHAQLNDNSQSLKQDSSLYDKTFASCLMGYQDSSVPLTLRLTYDSTDNNLLKLQVDNRICFQTRKIKLLNPEESLQIGVTSDNMNTPESFEILRMNFYDKVIDDSLIPNVNAMGQPKFLTKIIDEKTGTEKIVEKEKLDAQNKKLSTFELYKKMDRLEGKILANDINVLDEKINNIIDIQQTLMVQIETMSKLLLQNQLNDKNLQNKLNNDKNSENGKLNIDTNEEFKDFIAMNNKLEQMLNEQSKIREATHKANELHQIGPSIDEIVTKLTVWLIPLIVIMCIMAYYTFKIRQEIIKTKLL